MALKTWFDKTLSAVGLVGASPLFAAVSAVNAVHFRSSPFFLAERFGKDGVPFKIIKFKSMHDRGKPNSDLPDEARRSSWGHFLRATSIDELPQLLNILKGDMSFVGPRPRSTDGNPYDVIPEGYEAILSVKPGLAGPWQAAAVGRKTKIPPIEKAELDMIYVRQGDNFRQDITYMLQSFGALYKGHDGEYLGSRNQTSAKDKPEASAWGA